MSNIPRFETLNVEPVYSSGLRRRLRAFPARSRASAPISLNDFKSALRITGVMRPSSMATAMPMCTSFQYRMWSSWNQALHARWCTNANATALMMMSLNEIFPPAPSSPSCLLSASRASAARSMSISVVRKKCGTGPSEAASRLAIVFRIWVRGTSSYGTPVRGARSAVRGVAEAGAVAACAAGARSTSRLTTRPPGPEPCTSFRSTPASFAIRFASGDAFTRVAAGGVTGVDCAGDGAGAAARGDMGGVGAGLSSRAPSTFSPGFPIHATTFPTGTVLPSGTTTLISWPSARATNSLMALSVSTSASVSPDLTASPSCFVHFTSRPSSIVGDNASMWTLVAMGLLAVQHAPDGGDDLLGRRLGRALEQLVVRHRDVGLGDALHRRVEIIEGIPLDDVDDLRPDPAVRPAFLHHDRPGGLLDRFENRRLIDGTQRPQVEHFGRHVVLRELLRRLQCDAQRLRMAHQRHVAALALDVGAPDRDDVLTVGHLALEVVQHFAFEHDHRVVVADGRFEQALRVGGRRRGDDLQPGDMGEPALPCLRVLGRELQRRPIGAAEDDRQRDLAARHVQHLGGGIHDLVECEQGEVPGHELDDGPQPTHRRSHADARESQLRDWRVDDALRAELLQQSAAHLVGALIDAHLFAHQQDVGIALHLLAQRLIQCVSVSKGGHQSTRTSV